MILMHGFVPGNFGLGVTVPVVKDKLGDATAANNYRPITLSPVISKIFEYCIVQQYEHLLSFDTLQFGWELFACDLRSDANCRLLCSKW